MTETTAVAERREGTVALTSDAADQLGFLASAMATFEGVQRLADVMAKCGTMPAHLQSKPADCFRVVVQSAKWRMDPFAVGECTSLVHGKLCFEGKLVHAVLMSMGAIKGNLRFDFDGPERTDKRKVTVSGTKRDGSVHSLTGTVADWKTEGKGSPWSPGNYDRQLRYRGAREWARAFAPDALLGVYTPDEMENVKEAEFTVAEPEVARTAANLPDSVSAQKQAEQAAPAGPDHAETHPEEPVRQADPAEQASDDPHPAIAKARGLYRALFAMIADGDEAKEAEARKDATAIIGRLSGLHGAKAPKDIPDAALDQFEKDVEELLDAVGEGEVRVYDLLGTWEQALREGEA